MVLVMCNKHIVRKAYKKLKADVYYDKTMPILKYSIAEFESKHEEKIDDYLDDIYTWLTDDKLFQEKIQCILDEIDYISLPKTFKTNKEEHSVISNHEVADCEIEDIQYYINMPVEGHILGVLWVMLIGRHLDESLNKHVYANRISKYLVNESENYDASTYLFEPYFVKYESWRNKGLDYAENIIADKDNVMIITLDLEKYYYSVDINKNVMKYMFDEVNIDELSEKEKVNLDIYRHLNDFVGDVIEYYAGKFENEFDNRKILPIGFLPSNIISNWVLRDFDRAIIDGWNPVYYGRYVDDILIVDRVTDDSYIGQMATHQELTNEEIVDIYFTSCNRFGKHSYQNNDDCNNLFKLALKPKENNEPYTINPIYHAAAENKSCIKFNPNKTKLFYFDWQESSSLIKCFKKQIAKNKSEFRHMPDDEAFRKDDYTDIYSLVNEGGLNKLRGVKAFEVDKFELSKFIGKYLRICAMIDTKEESRFEKDILEVFTKRVVLDNYFLWEKVIEIFVVKENYKGLKRFCDRVYGAIDSIKSKKDTKKTRDGLKKILCADLYRCLALVWKKARKDEHESLRKYFFNNTDDNVEGSIINYCKARMIDRSVMPILFDMLELKDLSCDANINFTSFEECTKFLKCKWDSTYHYFPYMLTVIDSCLISNLEVTMNNRGKDEFKASDVLKRYSKVNFYNDFVKNERGLIDEDTKGNIRYIAVGNGKKDILKIAIANVVLKYENFQGVVLEKRNRSYDRYKNLSHIVNEAVDNNADILVMPEAYLPYEWLPVLAQTCKKEQIAIITGIEHFKIAEKMWNFTAVMLPYEVNEHKDAYINFHLKNHYAPSEIESITGYDLTYEEGNSYELYKWNDCYFPVYCCYELASIKDRAIFQSYADLIVAVEWNRDVKYYSNIAESLSRDVHCYFVQVNSANYGDSRIVKPTKNVEKDLIRTKGGINSSVLVDIIDIKKLREFQIKNHTLQKQDGSFKLTPPNLDREIVWKKIKNEPLWI